MTEHFPEFFCEMRRKRSEKKQKSLSGFPDKRRFFTGQSLVFIDCIEELHHTGNRRVELESFRVRCNRADRVMKDIAQFFIILIQILHSDGSRIGFDAPDFVHQALNAGSELNDCLDSVVAPRTAVRVSKSESKIGTEYIGTVFVDILIRSYRVALGFGHPVAVRSEDDSLMNNRFERFIEIKKD